MYNYFQKVYFTFSIICLYVLVCCRRFLPHISSGKNNVDLIVSLTSYGSRVNDLLPYTLFSILEQSVMPKKIIVWLDSENWNMNNLPHRLMKMIKHGVDVRFCKDIRSYTKLVYALREFPNYPIVTVDDDQYYGKYMIEGLYNNYMENPKSISCVSAHVPKIVNNTLLPYNEWRKNVREPFSGYIFPLGVTGILYPPFSLSLDVFDEHVFLDICPTADDVWFWAMGLRNNAKYEIVPFNTKFLHIFPLDRFYFKMEKLTTVNVVNCKNDYQIKKVFDYYDIWCKLNIY